MVKFDVNLVEFETNTIILDVTSSPFNTTLKKVMYKENLPLFLAGVWMTLFKWIKRTLHYICHFCYTIILIFMKKNEKWHWLCTQHKAQFATKLLKRTVGVHRRGSKQRRHHAAVEKAFSPACNWVWRFFYPCYSLHFALSVTQARLRAARCM